jgi:hypothetical protein
MQSPHKIRLETLLGARQQAPDYAEIEARLLAALDAARDRGDGWEIRRLPNQLRNLLD